MIDYINLLRSGTLFEPQAKRIERMVDRVEFAPGICVRLRLLYTKRAVVRYLVVSFYSSLVNNLMDTATQASPQPYRKHFYRHLAGFYMHGSKLLIQFHCLGADFIAKIGGAGAIRVFDYLRRYGRFSCGDTSRFQRSGGGRIGWVGRGWP